MSSQSDSGGLDAESTSSSSDLSFDPFDHRHFGRHSHAVHFDGAGPFTPYARRALARYTASDGRLKHQGGVLRIDLISCTDQHSGASVGRLVSAFLAAASPHHLMLLNGGLYAEPHLSDIFAHISPVALAPVTHLSFLWYRLSREDLQWLQQEAIDCGTLPPGLSLALIHSFHSELDFQEAKEYFEASQWGTRFSIDDGGRFYGAGQTIGKNAHAHYEPRP
jgi:hypothetical protein